MTDSEKIKKAIRKPQPTKTSIKRSDLLNTGSTILNLACTGYPDGGFWKGAYFYIVGGSSAGKTFLARTCLAEATINKNFDDYRIIDDDTEGGALMDTEKYFGKRLADRIEAPSYDDDDEPVYSDTIEDFYFNLDDALDNNQPCIYLLDSQDALGSKYEQNKFDEKKKASRQGKKAKGDYGDGKAKIHSAGMRNTLAKLKDTGSILIVTGHVKDNVGGSMFEPKETTSGGRSLRYYAMMQLWMSMGKKRIKAIKKIDRVIGVTSKIRVVKNRSIGKERNIEFPIYYNVGIDDLEGCVEYLIKEGHWKKNNSGIINAKDFNFEGKINPLIKYIEENNYEMDLKFIVTEVWNEIESLCEVERKPRF